MGDWLQMQVMAVLLMGQLLRRAHNVSWRTQKLSISKNTLSIQFVAQFFAFIRDILALLAPKSWLHQVARDRDIIISKTISLNT